MKGNHIGVCLFVCFFKYLCVICFRPKWHSGIQPTLFWTHDQSAEWDFLQPMSAIVGLVILRWPFLAAQITHWQSKSTSGERILHSNPHRIFPTWLLCFWNFLMRSRGSENSLVFQVLMPQVQKNISILSDAGWIDDVFLCYLQFWCDFSHLDWTQSTTVVLCSHAYPFLLILYNLLPLHL